MEKVRILIVDDHQLILSGITDMLRPVKHFEIVGSANNGREAIELAISLNPDVIFMDISMPNMNGIEATGIITKQLPEVKIIALTQHEESEYVKQILNLGGRGYLLKNSKKEEFVEAIEAVMAGRRYLSRQISDLIITDLIIPKPEAKVTEKVTLTRREKEIIQKIADELSNQEIADELFISLRTVETHRRNIMQKLKVKSVVSLIKYAAQNNIIEL